MPPKPDLPILPFATAGDWADWLGANHGRAAGIWIRIFKKASGVRTVVHAEAVEVALCWGWIDGQRKRLDETSFLQKFTPRRPRSIWSKINRDTAVRLIGEKRVTAAGLRAVEEAKRNGNWERAVDPPRAMQAPPDFLAALAKNAKARRFYATLNRTNTFAIAARIHNAKRPETRARRIATFVAMLAKGEKLY